MTRAFLAVLLACSACATEFAREPTPSDFAKVTPGRTTANEVRALLGAPLRTLPWTLGQGETWAYPYRGDYQRRVFWVEVAADGLVRGTSDAIDLDSRYRF